MNDILQWAVLVALTLVVLGILRQIGLWLPEVARANTTSGPVVGRRLPRKLASEIAKSVPDGSQAPSVILAFVVENCAGCQRLIADLRESAAATELPIVLIARDASPQFREALAETQIPAIFANGELWAECRVTNTPLVVKMGSDGKVLTKGVTHNVDTVALTAS